MHWQPQLCSSITMLPHDVIVLDQQYGGFGQALAEPDCGAGDG
jgi:hypothetical protein